MESFMEDRPGGTSTIVHSLPNDEVILSVVFRTKSSPKSSHQWSLTVQPPRHRQVAVTERPTQPFPPSEPPGAATTTAVWASRSLRLGGGGGAAP